MFLLGFFVCLFFTIYSLRNPKIIGCIKEKKEKMQNFQDFIFLYQR